MLDTQSPPIWLLVLAAAFGLALIAVLLALVSKLFSEARGETAATGMVLRLDPGHHSTSYGQWWGWAAGIGMFLLLARTVEVSDEFRKSVVALFLIASGVTGSLIAAASAHPVVSRNSSGSQDARAASFVVFSPLANTCRPGNVGGGN